MSDDELPRCPVHPDDVAHRTCVRCGSFMCRECSARWVEEKCPTCRPKFGPPELTERRMGRVKKLPFLRCDVCGLESPRLDRHVGDSAFSIGLALLGTVFTAGFAGLAWLLLATSETEPVCPGCERSDELEPSLHTDLPKPAGFDELEREFGARRRRYRLIVLGLTLTSLALVVVFGGLIRFR